MKEDPAMAFDPSIGYNYTRTTTSWSYRESLTAMRAPAPTRHPHASAPRNTWFPLGSVNRRDRRRRRKPGFALEVLEDRTLPAASILGSVWNELVADGRRAGEPGLAHT